MKKYLAIATVVILILNILAFAAGWIPPIVFWIVIGLSALINYVLKHKL